MDLSGSITLAAELYFRRAQRVAPDSQSQLVAAEVGYACPSGVTFRLSSAKKSSSSES